MLAADRRMGIVSILVACGHATTRELAQEFGVSRRTIMHWFYSRDISKKVKSGKHIRALEGKFMGTTAPFGYRKDPQDKNHLIVDETTAPTVRLIYDLALEGYGTNRIGKVLYERKIPKPGYYKQEYFSNTNS